MCHMTIRDGAVVVLFVVVVKMVFCTSDASPQTFLCVRVQTFEVHVPVSGERGCSKKISYTNPYSSRRTFLLRSDHPDLLQFKEDCFQVRLGSRSRAAPRPLESML